MPVLEDVYELLGRPEVAGRAVYFWGHAGLHKLRVRDLLGTALRTNSSGRRSAENPTFGEGIGCSWVVVEPLAQGCGEANPMEHPSWKRKSR